MATLQVLADKQGLNLEDGIHEGEIVDVDVNNRSGYDYLDLTIEVQEANMEQPATIKAGYPLPVRPSSMAGKLFQRFGVSVVPEGFVDTQSLLRRKIKFITIKGDKYIEVQRDSLKPTSIAVQG
jgi:hypothetical protein